MFAHRKILFARTLRHSGTFRSILLQLNLPSLTKKSQGLNTWSDKGTSINIAKQSLTFVKSGNSLSNVLDNQEERVVGRNHQAKSWEGLKKRGNLLLFSFKTIKFASLAFFDLNKNIIGVLAKLFQCQLLSLGFHPLLFRRFWHWSILIKNFYFIRTRKMIKGYLITSLDFW